MAVEKVITAHKNQFSFTHLSSFLKAYLRSITIAFAAIFSSQKENFTENVSFSV